MEEKGRDIMEGWAFLGGFLAVVLGIVLLVLYIRKKVRSFSRKIFGTADIVGALKDIDTTTMETPRSLSGCDNILLPKILKDFPDMDIQLAKTYIRDHLRMLHQGKASFKIHNVVIAKYLRSAVQKCIVFQAALCYRENSRTIQKRYDLYYTYILPQTSDAVAANCPNCDGVLGFGDTVCPFCGSRVANVLGNTWEITDVIET